jgi:hypothetical protein
MNPSSIRELTASARALQKTKRQGSPEAFILAWIAWEGMKLRILAVVQKKMGTKIKDTYLSHQELRLWNQVKFEKQWKQVFGKNPSNMSGVAGKVFREMEKYKKYRDKLVHGKEFGNPVNVEKATLSILKILEDQEWLKEIKFSVKNKTYNIYEIYERNRK